MRHSSSSIFPVGSLALFGVICLALPDLSGAVLGSSDLDSASTRNSYLSSDRNGNGLEDAVEIATGAVVDLNEDGVPDDCQGQASLDCVPFNWPSSPACCPLHTGSEPSS